MLLSILFYFIFYKKKQSLFVFSQSNCLESQHKFIYSIKFTSRQKIIQQRKRMCLFTRFGISGEEWCHPSPNIIAQVIRRTQRLSFLHMSLWPIPATHLPYVRKKRNTPPKKLFICILNQDEIIIIFFKKTCFCLHQEGLKMIKPRSLNSHI